MADARGRADRVGVRRARRSASRSRSGGRVVRELGPGEVLGELALLTGEPRSAERARQTRLGGLRAAARGVRPGRERRSGRGALRAAAGGRAAAHRRRARAGPRARPRRRWWPWSGLQPGVVAAEVADHLARRMGQHLRVVAAGRRRRRRPRPGRADPRPGRAGRRARRRGRRAPVAGLLPPRGRRRRAGGRRRCRPAARSYRRRPAAPSWCSSARPRRRRDAPTGSLAVDAWQLTLVSGDLATALRPVADRLAGRSLGLVLAGGGARAFAHVGVLRELEDAGLPRRPGRGHQHRRRSSRPCARDGRTGARARGRLLRRVGAPQAVQRLGAPGAVAVQGPPGARRDDPRHGRGRGLRGAPPSGPSRQRRPHVADPPGPRARQPRRGRPGLGPAAGALRPDAAGRRTAADRRRRARQPAGRPADRARRGAGRRRQHRHRGRRAPRDVAGRGCPPSARRSCAP